MLKADIKIVFFATGIYKKGYDVDKVKSVTFMLASDEYYIGFIDNNDNSNGKYYVFGNEYKVIVTFPSLSEENYKKYINIWKENNKVNICLGKKVIGEGRILSYSLI